MTLELSDSPESPCRRGRRSLFGWFRDVLVFRAIRRSGFFAGSWYMATYPDFRVWRATAFLARWRRRRIPIVSKFAALIAHPLFHYVRFGAAEQRDPCLFFSTRRYLEHYPEVVDSGLNPFLHYIQYGAREGRSGYGQMELDISRLAEIRRNCFGRLGVKNLTTAEMEANCTLPIPDRRIAVHLHLFYPELLEHFLTMLAHIPKRFDLFVSAPVPALPAELFRRCLPRLHRLVWECVPNRGRDLAPFQVTFGSRLRHYDFICHIHSKKSPHDARLSGWLEQMTNTLLGSPEQIGRIFALLEHNGKFVYPDTHPQTDPDPVTGWSCNYNCAGTLLRMYTEIKQTDFPVIDFPHGSMFWAHSQALRRFFDLPLSYADFPKEPILPDGTTAHALERLFLILASDVPGIAYKIIPEPAKKPKKTSFRFAE